MARILIVYQSKTGHTAAMAEAVEAGVASQGVEVIRKKIEEAGVDDLPGADGIIIGTPTYFGSVTADIKRLIDKSIKYHKKLEGKVGAAFASAGALGGGGETAILDVLRAFLVHGMIVPGFARDGHYGPLSVGLPDDERREVCQEFGARVARLVKAVSGRL
ncbi:MAG: flavodoxin family protein [Deltaproteobacteria bacterium]|nr:flavodoxin family protein [Deltaproteobacteria bacterium]